VKLVGPFYGNIRGPLGSFFDSRTSNLEVGSHRCFPFRVWWGLKFQTEFGKEADECFELCTQANTDAVSSDLIFLASMAHVYCFSHLQNQIMSATGPPPQ
jgi:hypothetical protein